MRAMGVECGRGCAPDGPISNAPQLTHARELIGLQKRFGSRRIEWVRTQAGRRPVDLALWADEVCVVFEGRLNLSMPVFMGRGSLSLDAGEWLARPSNPARALLARAEPGLQRLRLHACVAAQALAA